MGPQIDTPGDWSRLTRAAAHGEDNRRGREHITSHTPVDPFGVGGFLHSFSQPVLFLDHVPGISAHSEHRIFRTLPLAAG